MKKTMLLIFIFCMIFILGSGLKADSKKYTLGAINFSADTAGWEEQKRPNKIRFKFMEGNEAVITVTVIVKEKKSAKTAMQLLKEAAGSYKALEPGKENKAGADDGARGVYEARKSEFGILVTGFIFLVKGGLLVDIRTVTMLKHYNKNKEVLKKLLDSIKVD